MLTIETALRKDLRAKPVQMPHRHIAFIAAIIRENDLGKNVEIAFARCLAEAKPRFSVERFLSACRGE